MKIERFLLSMERFGGSLPVKGYSGEMAGKKRVQLPVDIGKGRQTYRIYFQLIITELQVSTFKN